MRKRIDAQPAKVETQVDSNPFVTAYQTLHKRLSYNKDRDTDLSVLDYQDALQDTIIDVLEKNPFADSPVAFLKHATKMAVLRVDRYAKVEFFGDDIDTMDIALPNGSIVDLKKCFTSYVRRPRIRYLYGLQSRVYTCRDRHYARHNPRYAG